VKIAFLLQKIEDARIIRAYFEEKGHRVAIYRSPEDMVNLDFTPEVSVIDIKCINTDDELRLVISSSTKILFILPFWENAGKKIEEIRSKAKIWGFKQIKIKVIKKPFTPEELLKFIIEIFQIKE
jgi:DNA-binding response OmpR family regulator